jgi:hypothetical protein
MRNVIACCEEIGAEVFYTNTDCLLFRLEDVEKVNAHRRGKLLGEELGQFTWEFSLPSRKFICLSQKKYLHCFDDGTVRVRFPPREVEAKDLEAWFERKYEEKVNA